MKDNIFEYRTQSGDLMILTRKGEVFERTSGWFTEIETNKFIDELKSKQIPFKLKRKEFFITIYIHHKFLIK